MHKQLTKPIFVRLKDRYVIILRKDGLDYKFSKMPRRRVDQKFM